MHFAECDKAGKIFGDLADMAGVVLTSLRERRRWGLFALAPTTRRPPGEMHPTGATLGHTPQVWVSLHLLLWKQLIALLVRIDMENEKFEPEKVWAPAWIRLERKIKALHAVIMEAHRRKEARGEQPPKSSRRSGPIRPIAEFDDSGNLIWNEDLKKRLLALSGRSMPDTAAP